MAVERIQHLIRASALCEDRLNSMGFSLSVRKAPTSEAPLRSVGKDFVTRDLSPEHVTDNPEDQFWLYLHDRDGDEVGVAGSKLMRTANAGFADLVARQYARIYKGQINAESSIATLAEIVPPLVGDIAYFGDLWINPKHRGQQVSSRPGAQVGQRRDGRAGPSGRPDQQVSG